MSEFKDVLELALDGVAAPGPKLEVAELRAAAKRVRRRRRAVVLGGTSLAVAVAVPLALGGLRSAPPAVAPPAVSSSAPEPSASKPKPMELLRSLLPKGIGQVEPVLSKDTPKAMATTQFAAQQAGTGLAGSYTVRNGGGVGLIVIQVDQLATPHVKSDSACDPGHLPVYAYDCFQKDLPGGVLLWSLVEGHDVNTPINGPLALARVYFPNGRTVMIVSSAGTTGPTGYGPLLPAPPLTQQQVVALVEQPMWRTQD